MKSDTWANPPYSGLQQLVVTKPESCNVHTLVGTKFLHYPLALSEFLSNDPDCCSLYLHHLIWIFFFNISDPKFASFSQAPELDRLAGETNMSQIGYKYNQAPGQKIIK